LFRHNASEHNLKKNISTQTIESFSNEFNPLVKGNFPELNKKFEKLKICLYPDMFNNQNNNNGKLFNILITHIIIIFVVFNMSNNIILYIQ